MKEDIRVHIRFEKNSTVSLAEVVRLIKKIQEENPDREVYFDGDLMAICSKPLKKRSKG